MSKIDSDKILSNLDYLLRDMPVHLNVDLSGICNQKCSWCFFKGGIDDNTDVLRDQELRKYLVDTDKMISVLMDHRKYHGQAITFVGGGEPLMHPEATLIIRMAIFNKTKVGLITNLSTKLSKALIMTLNQCEWIRVSLDASTPETYKTIRGVDHFDRVIDNMKRIQPRTLGISFLVHPMNYQDIKGIFKIADSVQADYVQFKPVYLNDEKLSNSPDIGEINALINSSVGDYKGEVINEYGSRLEILSSKDRDPVTKEKFPHIPCLIGRYRVHIASDGEVYPCCIYKYSKEYSYGSFYEQPLIEVLKSDQRIMVDTKLYIDECPMCWDKACQQKLHKVIMNEEHLSFV